MKNIKNLINKAIGSKKFKVYVVSTVAVVILAGGGFFLAKSHNDAKAEEQQRLNITTNKDRTEKNLDTLVDTATKELMEAEKAKGNNITEEEARKKVEEKIDKNASIEEQVAQAEKQANAVIADKETTTNTNANKELAAQQEAVRKEEQKQQAEAQAKAEAEAKKKAEQAAAEKAAQEEAARQAAAAEAARKAAEEAAKKEALSGWKDDVAYSIYGGYSYNYEFAGTSLESPIVSAFNSLVNGAPVNVGNLNTKMFNESQDQRYLYVYGYGKVTVKGLNTNDIFTKISSSSSGNIRDYMLVKVYYDGPSDTSTIYFIGCEAQFSKYGIAVNQ